VQSREADGSTIHEAAAGVPAVEMQGHGYGDGYGVKGAAEMDSARAWNEHEAERQSRFVEGGLWGPQGQGQGQPAQTAQQQGIEQQQQQQQQQTHYVYGGHDGGLAGGDAGTVGTEKDVEGLQRRLKGLSG
jgi:hypothetical protein